MKAKFLFVIIAAVTFASNAFGQGQVVLANNAGSLIRNTHDGSAVPVGSMSFQLYFAFGVVVPESSLMPVGPVVGTSTTFPGRIANTVIDIPLAAGSSATFQVWAWSSRFASYAEAAASGDVFSGNGKSITFNATTSPNGQPPPLPTSLAGLYQGFSVSIPEPSTFVLVGLGIASLLLFRRRK